MACLKVDTIVKCAVAGAIKHKVPIQTRLAASSGHTLGSYQLGHSIAVFDNRENRSFNSAFSFLLYH